MAPIRPTYNTPLKRGRGRGLRGRPTSPSNNFAPADTALTTITQGDNSTTTIENMNVNVSLRFSHNVPPLTANQINNFRKAMFVKDMMANPMWAEEEMRGEGAVLAKHKEQHSSPALQQTTPYNSAPAPLNPAQAAPPLAAPISDQLINQSFQNLSFDSKQAREDDGYVSDATEAMDSEDERLLLRRVKNPNGRIDEDRNINRRDPYASATAPPPRRKRALPPGESCPLPPANFPAAPEPDQPRLPNVFAARAQRDAAKRARSPESPEPPSSAFTTLGQGNSGPDLSLPMKKRPKREGYGFSYSDPSFASSIPDTDSEGEADEPLPVSRAIDSFLVRSGAAKAKRNLPTNDTFTFASPAQEQSADVVLRSIGTSYNFARPERPRPCTFASRADTIVVQAAGNSLLKFRESAEIYGNLSSRLERMVQASPNPDMPASARKLRDFVFTTMEARVETGEIRALVEHEGEWANWFVQATSTGVMHWKREGCNCRPEWEE